MRGSTAILECILFSFAVICSLNWLEVKRTTNKVGSVLVLNIDVVL